MAEASSSARTYNRTPKKLYPDHSIKKRTPHKPEINDNVIYINTKSDIRGLKAKCEKLMKNNEKEIVVYSLGAAIQRSIVLALQLCEYNPTYDVATNTLTTELIDDLEPAADDADYEIQRRNNSALRIRLIKKDPLQERSN